MRDSSSATNNNTDVYQLAKLLVSLQRRLQGSAAGDLGAASGSAGARGSANQKLDPKGAVL